MQILRWSAVSFISLLHIHTVYGVTAEIEEATRACSADRVAETDSTNLLQVKVDRDDGEWWLSHDARVQHGDIDSPSSQLLELVQGELAASSPREQEAMNQVSAKLKPDSDGGAVTQTFAKLKPVSDLQDASVAEAPPAAAPAAKATAVGKAPAAAKKPAAVVPAPASPPAPPAAPAPAPPAAAGKAPVASNSAGPAPATKSAPSPAPYANTTAASAAKIMQPLKKLSAAEAAKIKQARDKVKLDCLADPWTKWGPCGFDTNDMFLAPHQSRKRVIVQHQKKGGKACPSKLTEVQMCKQR